MKRIVIVLSTILLLLASACAFAQEIKDPRPGVPENPFIRLPCGPDNWGYVCTDPCDYIWVDISSTGQLIIASGDDTSSGPIALSTPFDFYGTTYNNLVMSSNGYISTLTTDSGGDLTNDCPLPNPPSTGGGARIYILHDDLDLEAGIGEGYYQYFTLCPRPGRDPEEPCTVFMWDDVSHFPGSSTAPTWDMEVILYHYSGDIAFQIGAGNPELGSSSTTGLQSADMTYYMNIVCNTAVSVPDEACWLITNPFTVAVESATFGTLKALYR